jgi:hypothetical protein
MFCCIPYHVDAGQYESAVWTDETRETSFPYLAFIVYLANINSLASSYFCSIICINLYFGNLLRTQQRRIPIFRRWVFRSVFWSHMHINLSPAPRTE